MRDIVFRAKRKDTGEWTYGIPFPHGYKGLSMFRQHTVDGSLVGENADLDTLGQYTGLRDRHGVQIFEGDLVTIDSPGLGIDEEDGRGEVFWDDEAARFSITLSDNLIDFDSFHSCYDLEVVGNIHDNTNMLSGKNGGETQ